MIWEQDGGTEKSFYSLSIYLLIHVGLVLYLYILHLPLTLLLQLKSWGLVHPLTQQQCLQEASSRVS